MSDSVRDRAGDPPRILIIGAHPDDADIKAGGTAAKWCALGLSKVPRSVLGRRLGNPGR